MITNEQFLHLAEHYGTPLYIYDGNKIQEQFKRFQNAFKVKDLKIHFAVKSLSNISILKLFKQLGAGLDCVSLEEVKLGLHTGFSPDEIIFTPNGVAFEEYLEAMKIGTHITVDNITTLEKIGANCPNQPIFIRLNPHLMAGGNQNISVGHVGSKFGISIHQLPNVHRIVKNYNLNVEGIHIHTGSDIIDADVFERVAHLILSIAEQFPQIKSIDFGSGFKVQYKSEDPYTNIEEVGGTFSRLFNEFCKKQNKEITLRFEPGKFMVSESGSLLTKVNVIKQTTACTFAGVNSGFNHLIRPMLYDAYHQIDNISNPDGTKKMYSVVGYICETDTFAEDRRISFITEGDILKFSNAGAYCFSMSSNFNSRLRPAEVLVLDGKDYLIREREDFDYLLQYQKMADFEV